MMFSRLYTLLLVVVAVGASWAAFGAVGGTAASTILASLAVYIWAGKSPWSRYFRMAAPAIWLVAVIGLLFPAIQAARQAALGMGCSNNLKQIGCALRNYWDVHECYPPVSTVDATGRPMHSWRLLIKPFLDATGTYSMCDFNEPWDSPKNKKVLAKRQYGYKCPSDQVAQAPDSPATSYVAIVGRRAALRWGKNGSTGGHHLPPETADAFLVVELADSGIQWAEPNDIQFDDLPALRSLAAKRPHLRNNGYFFHPTPAANAVLVHGDMIFMFPWDSTSGVLSGLLPPDVSGASWQPKHNPADDLYREPARISLPHCIGLPVWILAVGLLICHVVRHRGRIG